MAYATTAQLDTWVGESQTLPSTDEQTRLLERASQVVDAILIGAVYAVDSNSLPTDSDVADALADATCAQVEWWLESGDEHGSATAWDQVSIGSVSLGRGGSSGGGGGASTPVVAPRAAQRLQLAGLLPGTLAMGPRQ